MRAPTWPLADIPLLYATGRQGEFDAVIVVACDPETQLRRVIERDGLSEDDARGRIASQLPIADKIRQADHVITTTGTLDETDEQVRQLWKTRSAR